jgi:hypothetical protein
MIPTPKYINVMVETAVQVYLTELPKTLPALPKAYKPAIAVQLYS